MTKGLSTTFDRWWLVTANGYRMLYDEECTTDNRCFLSLLYRFCIPVALLCSPLTCSPMLWIIILLANLSTYYSLSPTPTYLLLHHHPTRPCRFNLHCFNAICRISFIIKPRVPRIPRILQDDGYLCSGIALSINNIDRFLLPFRYFVGTRR